MDFEKKYLVKEEHTLHAKKEGLENWAVSRAELNDRRFQQIEEDIRKIRDNELHHLKLENMPAVKDIINEMYVTNKSLLDGVIVLKLTIQKIKLALGAVLFISFILSWLI